MARRCLREIKKMPVVLMLCLSFKTPPRALPGAAEGDQAAVAVVEEDVSGDNMILNREI
jgi:hypothetical protein